MNALGSNGLNDLIRNGTLSQEVADFLMKNYREGKNILVTGKTGIGKTVLLRSIINEGLKTNRKSLFIIEKHSGINLTSPKVKPINLPSSVTKNEKMFLEEVLFRRKEKLIIDDLYNDLKFKVNTNVIASMQSTDEQSTLDKLVIENHHFMFEPGSICVNLTLFKDSGYITFKVKSVKEIKAQPYQQPVLEPVFQMTRYGDWFKTYN